MKHFKSIAVASVIAALPFAANALGFSVLNSSSNGIGNTADVFAPEYGAILPGTASWQTGAVPTTVTPPPGNVSGAFVSPWANTDSGLDATNGYFVVQPRPASGEPASDDPAKLSLGGLSTVFTFLWGSIDVENTITFLRGGSAIDSVTGSQVVGATTRGGEATLAGCGVLTNNSYNCVAEVEFTDINGFDEIWFSAGTDDGTPRNSFEFAMVPLPAAAWLLLGVSGALVAAKRRSARRAA